MHRYSEKKSENFSYYCREGKMTFVKKWIDNPNVDINWNYHSPLRNAVKYNQIEVIKLLLDRDDLKTDYENQPRELKGTWKGIDMIFNPFTEAMKSFNKDVLDLFIDSGKFKVDRIEHLVILKQIGDDTMNEYFNGIPGFTEFIIAQDDDFDAVLPITLRDLFLF